MVAFGRYSFVLFVVMLLVFSSTADARRGGKMRGLAPGVRHTGAVLSLEQLKACVQHERFVDAAEVRLAALQASLKSKERDIAELGRKIDDSRETLDRYSSYEVDAYNALIDEHETAVDAYNAKLLPINRLIDDMNSTIERFNASCADKVYYESDMSAIRAGQ